jgi:HK97 family phage major capsid protein
MGDFTQLLIGVRYDVTLEVVKEAYLANWQYGIVAHLRADVALAHPESFCKLIGILP